MKWLALIKLGLLIISKWFEHNEEKKKLKEEAVNEVKKGIKNNDTTRITSGFDRINRM